MRVLVTGSRDWEDSAGVWSALDGLIEDHYYDLTIVHGACPTGADKHASTWCEVRVVDQERHPALWEKYGKSAGQVRNREMVQSRPDFFLAFIRNDSRGAGRTVSRAREARIPGYAWYVYD